MAGVRIEAAGIVRAPRGALTGSEYRIEAEGRVLVVTHASSLRTGVGGDLGRVADTFLERLLPLPEGPALGDAIGNAIRAANHTVLEERDPFSGQAVVPVSLATLVFLGSQVVAANVGNTRAYRVRGGHIARLDREAGGTIAPPVSIPSSHGVVLHRRHQVTRALGADPWVWPELVHGTARPGDRFMLCTASVWTAISQDTLAASLDRARTPEQALAVVEARLTHTTRICAVVAYVDQARA